MEGFSFKIFSLLQYPIYDKYGLRGERSLTSRLTPSSKTPTKVVLLVQSEHDRKNWIGYIREQIEYAKMFDSARVTEQEDEFIDPLMDQEPATEEGEIDAMVEEVVQTMAERLKKSNRSIGKQTTKKMGTIKTDLLTKVNSIEKKALAVQTNFQRKNTVALSVSKFLALALACFVFGRYFL